MQRQSFPEKPTNSSVGGVKRFILVLLAILAVCGIANARKLWMTLDPSKSYMWVADTLKTSTPDTLFITIPRGVNIDIFGFYMMVDSISCTVSPKITAFYRPLPDMLVKIPMAGVTTPSIWGDSVYVRLDTVACGSAFIPIAWYTSAFASDDTITTVGKRTFWYSYVANQSSSSSPDPFSPPNSRLWEVIFKNVNATDTVWTAFGVSYELKR